jgi:hypothetical protein
VACELGTIQAVLQLLSAYYSRDPSAGGPNLATAGAHNGSLLPLAVKHYKPTVLNLVHQ